MALVSNRLSQLHQDLKKRHPKCKELSFLATLEAELNAIGEDTDSDLYDMDRRDKYDLQEHNREIVGERPLVFQQKEYHADQNNRIDLTHKKILKEAPSLFLKTTKPKLAVDTKDPTAAGRTQLHKAAVKGDLETVKSLVEQGADLFLKDNSGQTAGDLALDEEHMEVATYLATAMTKRPRN